MSYAEQVGQVIELVEHVNLYGREQELVHCVLRGEFVRASSLCEEALRHDYMPLPGVPYSLARRTAMEAKRVEVLLACLAALRMERTRAAA